MARRYRHRSNGRSRKLFLRHVWRTQRPAIARQSPHGHRAAPSRACLFARDSNTGPDHPPDPFPHSRTASDGMRVGQARAGPGLHARCRAPRGDGRGRGIRLRRGRGPAVKDRLDPRGRRDGPDEAVGAFLSGTPATTSSRAWAQLKMTGIPAGSGTVLADSGPPAPGRVGPGRTRHGPCVRGDGERPSKVAGREQEVAAAGRRVPDQVEQLPVARAAVGRPGSFSRRAFRYDHVWRDPGHRFPLAGRVLLLAELRMAGLARVLAQGLERTAGRPAVARDRHVGKRVGQLDKPLQFGLEFQ